MGQVAQTRTLQDLGLNVSGPGPRITGLTLDSRAVRPGFLFAALPGSAVHGARFAGYAIQQGAVAKIGRAHV